MASTEQIQYQRYCAENPVEAVRERIRAFLDATQINTLEEAEAELAEWGYVDVPMTEGTTGVFRMYLDPGSGKRYRCEDAEQVISVANGDFRYPEELKEWISCYGIERETAAWINSNDCRP